MAHQEAPFVTGRQASESRATGAGRTFRGPEFQQELARSVDLGENFDERILDFLAPLQEFETRQAGRGLERLRDQFRLTGGSKSSFAGQQASRFLTDLNLNQQIARGNTAAKFFGPLAALQQNRLAVAGAPLSESQSETVSSGTGTDFGFDPRQGNADAGIRAANAADLQNARTRRDSQSLFGGTGGGSLAGGIGAGGTLAALRQNPSSGFFQPPRSSSTGIRGGLSGAGANADVNALLGNSPNLFGLGGGGGGGGGRGSIFDQFGGIGNTPASSGGGGGGGVFFDPATGLAQSTSGPNRGFDQFGQDFNLVNFDQDFLQGL